MPTAGPRDGRGVLQGVRPRAPRYRRLPRARRRGRSIQPARILLSLELPCDVRDRGRGRGASSQITRTRDGPGNARRHVGAVVVSLMRCGDFTRGDRPLRWPASCECCRRPVGVPYWFATPAVSLGGKARYRCHGCRHVTTTPPAPAPDASADLWARLCEGDPIADAPIRPRSPRRQPNQGGDRGLRRNGPAPGQIGPL